jgi:glutamate carboxypeptidase
MNSPLAIIGTVSDILSACERQIDWLMAFVRHFVSLESPSNDRQPLEACAVWLAGELTRTGAAVERLPGAPTVDHVLARWPGQGTRVLLVGHFDTVWPVGQIARMPIVEQHGRLYGPGVLDMKAGLGIGVLAARVVGELSPAAARPQVSLLATSDEEVGSGTSRGAIERLALESDAVLVLEPALPGGAVKTARKGVGEFEIAAQGISSHAGADPGAGASAILELARQIVAVERLNDPGRGISVNVGVVNGGTRSNVVAESARALVDVRVARIEDAASIERALRALVASDARVHLDVRGGVNRPPMERTPGVARLFAAARDVAEGLGLDLAEGATGGASDGNFTAALGVPTLDGLGAVGDGPHALHEHVLIKELAPRAALVAGLIRHLSDN